MIAEMFVYGAYFCGENSYLKQWINLIEFIINILFMTYLLGGSAYFRQVGVIRFVAFIEFMELFLKNKITKMMLVSLFRSVPSIFSLIVIEFIFFYALGAINVELFGGSLYSCDLKNVPLSLRSKVKDRSQCLDYGGDWVNPVQNFDNIIFSMGVVFRLVTSDDWTDIIENMVDADGINKMPIKNNYVWFSLYAVLLVVVCNILMLNFFAGVVLETFISEKDKLGGYFLLSKTQAEWLDLQTYIVRKDIKEKIVRPVNKVLYVIYKFFLYSKWGQGWEFVSVVGTSLIFLVKYHRMGSEYEALVNRWVIITFLVLLLEALLKIVCFGRHFFRNSSLVADLVFIALESVRTPVLTSAGLHPRSCRAHAANPVSNQVSELRQNLQAFQAHEICQEGLARLRCHLPVPSLPLESVGVDDHFHRDLLGHWHEHLPLLEA
jgi:hypothetical protein